MNVSMTGGSGFIGKLLCKALVSRGDVVTLLSRKGRVEQDVAVVVGDLTEASVSLDSFVANCDVLYHCAGEIANTALMHRLHVKGTTSLLAAVHRRIKRTGKPVHWVQLSSTGAYGRQADLAQIDESFDPAPVGEYEVTKTIADELVVALAAIEPLFTFTIVRPTVVIGQSMPNQSFFQLARMVGKGWFFYIGKAASNVSTYVHVNDVVSALVACGNDSRAAGHTFIIANDCAQKDVIDAFARFTGRKKPSLQIPEPVLRLLMRIIPSLVRLPLTPQRVDALVKKGGYANRHIREVLGFRFEYPIPESVPDVLRGNVLPGSSD